METYKVMWVPGTKKVVWSIQNEKQISLNSQPYTDIENLNFDLKKWTVEYRKLYRLWLNEDERQIFDINHDINKRVIEMLIILNQRTDKYKLLYWFDINRDENPDFKWEYCPISKSALKENSKAIHSKNRYFSDSYPIVMPE